MATDSPESRKLDEKPDELELLKSSVDAERARLRYRLETGPLNEGDAEDLGPGKSRGKLNRIFRLCLGD
jgi:hypothetical protein